MAGRWWAGWLVGACMAGGAAAAAPALTATEQAWLEAAGPVLNFARERRVPLDIVVQPQPTPGETPLGMAFVDGRCKLVLSMRGNPAAQATLDSMPPALVGPIVEAIAAHELGHCWRHLNRTWGTVPKGMQEVSLEGRVPPDQAALLADMWRTRREEAFADLVGLAWTQRFHPGRYAEVHAWHARLRADQAVETGPHDTRTWVRMAADPQRFAPTASIFDQVGPLWAEGLLADE